MTYTNKQKKQMIEYAKGEIDKGVETITDLYDTINQSDFLRDRLLDRIKAREENETNGTR